MKRKVLTSLVFFVVGLAPIHAGMVDHVVVVSVDGLQSGLLQNLIASDPSGVPTFLRLQTEGAFTYNARADFTNTTTLPNHTSMLTGRPVDQPSGAPNTVHHGYTNNGTPAPTDTLHNQGNPNLPYIASMFDVAHDNNLSTSLYSSKSKFVIFEQSYNAANGAPDTTGIDNGTDKIDVYLNDDSFGTAANLIAGFVADLDAQAYNLSFVHIQDPDSVGHASGWGSSAYNQSLQDVDAYLASILAVVESNLTLLDRTMLIVTADHGGNGFGHGDEIDPDVYTIPFFVWGPDVTSGADLYGLNLATRQDPGTLRPDYNAPLQPIRNGDAGNLALSLLSLGPVPGSSINDAQNLAVPEPSSMMLVAAGLFCIAAWKANCWQWKLHRIGFRLE